jgi:D-alanyl-D-alanine carboxypeptidase
MLRWRTRTPLSGRSAFAGVAVLIAVLAAPPAYAQGKSTWFSGFSSIVVDAKTGEVIDASKADELRHPASLAKIMTLYLLFSELEAGRLKLTSDIRISPDAARQPPSKLGLQAGQTIDADDAIKAIVTRSANDVAVAIAEAISGDEDSFARLMTQRARSIGMTRTVFKNASGLPDPDQVTTARDMALLGLAIQDRFPKYYEYFSTRVFHWRGAAIGNHNRLLGSVDGVDGIKTGYTHASGFNLVSNVKRGGRHIVAVVMGGQSGAARDAHMRDMINGKIRFANAGPRLAPRFVERAVPMPAPAPRVAAARPQPTPGSSEPIARNPVRTVSVDKNSEILPEGDDNNEVLPVNTLTASTVREPLKLVPTGVAPEGKFVTFAPPPAATTIASASAQASPEIEQKIVMPTVAASTAPVALPATHSAIETEATASVNRGAWIVQIGAFPSEEVARNRLQDARGHAGGLLSKGYTEMTSKGSAKLYRARFAGFDESTARLACERLKKNDFSCFTTRN